MKEPVLSIITGKVGRDASFQRLVDSVIANTKKIPWELVVSDASPTPYAPSRRNIHVIHEQPRLTCVQGYNNAFRAARGFWCMYLNDDAEVTPDYARAAIDFMEAHPDIGLGALHYSEDQSEFHVNSAWDCIYANFGIIPRSLGNDIDWMDSDLTMYGNDNSLTFRVLLAGYGVADIPSARIIHHSVKDETRTENRKSQSKDNDILQAKYLPYRPQIKAMFDKYSVTTGTVPWSHGVRPDLVR